MRSKTTKKYLEDCAAKHNLTLKQMLEIAEAPFRFTAKTFAEGNRETMEFAAIRIMYFGKFGVKPGRIKDLKQLNDRRKENSSDTDIRRLDDNSSN